jgi:crotonobetainyl-CoA:carnitine CoA-transferase CaiB-like acyl-CoA transferase
MDRMDLFEKWPGSKYADHARGNRELQRELREMFKTKTSQEWLELGEEKNFPIAPVNSPKTLTDDPQFKDRFPLYPHAKHGADMLPFPVRFREEELPVPSHAPTVGEQSDEVLVDVLGYGADEIAALKKAGALG